MQLFWKTNRKTIKVAVVGNCQARPIAQIITSLCSKINVTTIAIVHLLKNEENEIYERDFRIADFIFAQRVADNYPCTFIRTDYLKNKWGDKVIVWPNTFYRGYNPELFYLRTVNRQPLHGPLGDYHNQTFLDGWKNGLSVTDTLNLHNSIEYNSEKYGNVPENSFNELIGREKDCDIVISNYIKKRLKRRRLFFTFNHPTMELLSYLGKSLINQAVIHPDRMHSLNDSEPLGQVQPPLNPWVANKDGLAHDAVNVWKGLTVNGINGDVVRIGKSQEYSNEEIVDTFFKIYSANKNNI